MARTSGLVLDVGNCDPDHFRISRMLTERFDVSIDRVMHVDEALERMRNRNYDLVLVNRLIFASGSPGIELVHQTQSDPGLRRVPVMLVSNYPDAQAAAVAAGCVPGFGKDGLNDSATHAKLSQYLSLATKS